MTITHYRFTPFHLASLWFMYQLVTDIRINATVGAQAGLGGLFPFFDLGFFVTTLLIDVAMQFLFFTYLKTDWKLLYLTQILIIILVFFIAFPTVHAPA